LIPFLKSGVFKDSRWKEDFQRPSGINQAQCSDAGLAQPDSMAPAGGELVLSGDTPACVPPSPSPEASPSPVLSPSPVPSPTFQILPKRSPAPSPGPSPSP